MKHIFTVKYFNYALLFIAFGLIVLTFISNNFSASNVDASGVISSSTATTKIVCPSGYTNITEKGLCGDVSACIKKSASIEGECTFGVTNCSNLKHENPAVGFTWSCYNRQCVQEVATSCKFKDTKANSCVSCGCSDSTPSCQTEKKAQCINGATSYSCLCAKCGNPVTFACDKVVTPPPTPITCYGCDRTNQFLPVVNSSTSVGNVCGGKYPYKDQATANAKCTKCIAVNWCDYCDRTDPAHPRVKAANLPEACGTVQEGFGMTYNTYTEASVKCIANTSTSYNCYTCDKATKLVSTKTFQSACSLNGAYDSKLNAQVQCGAK